MLLGFAGLGAEPELHSPWGVGCGVEQGPIVSHVEKSNMETKVFKIGAYSAHSAPDGEVDVSCDHLESVLSFLNLQFIATL